MLKKLRLRFVLFNMLIISIVLIVLALLVFFGTKNSLTGQKLLSVTLFSLALVFIASFLISKFALAPIKKAWQNQLDFTADASHELRTPLAVMQTNLELIMDNKTETIESQMKWLMNIDAENKRMTKLVDALLTLSRADTNQQNLDMKLFSLDEVTRQTVVSFEAIAYGKKISLCSTIAPQIVFTGDENRIRQLLIILLDNAMKYTDKGQVSITLTKKEKLVELIVTDTGVGIAPEDLGKIFDRFYRVTETRGYNRDGSGLGLSIAQWIVTEQGGSIHTESTLGQGTVFKVLLPLS